MPQAEDEWRVIAENFETKWNFPQCIGALDGKHITMKAPSNMGSLFFNYKGTFSIVLLALVAANYKFMYIDIGVYRRNGDGGIFSHSNLGRGLCTDQLNLPPDTHTEGAELSPWSNALCDGSR